ncbi:MAG: YihY/virulence factor BrkB family protein [Anaerovoracaceae bacterium]|jgi:membrane protein
MTSRRNELIFNVITRMRKPYYQGVAAELAFFFLMSMVPVFIIAAEIMGFFSISIDVMRELVSEYVNGTVADGILKYLAYSPSGTINILFIVFALWAASKAQFSMIRIANYTYTGMNMGKGFIRERFRAIVTVGLSITMLLLCLGILIGGEYIINLMAFCATQYFKPAPAIIMVLGGLRWPLAMGIFFLGISYIYYTLPTRKWTYRSQIPGAILATGGILIVTWVYSFYISHFSNYNLLYGSLATIVGLLVWFYFIGFVLVVGIVFNAAWEETKD